MKQFLAATLCLAICGCGGGGGSGGSFFGGIWKVSLVTTENTCGDQLPPIEAELTVNQSESEIAIESSTGNMFSGAVDGDQSFFASRQFTAVCVNSVSGEEVPGSTTTGTSTYRFSNIEGDNATVTVSVEFSNCSTNSLINTSCRSVQQGTGVRE